MVIANILMNDSTRRRRRRRRGGSLDKPSLDLSPTSPLWEKIEDVNFIPTQHPDPSQLNTIDSIKSELREESRYEVHSEFQDDAHHFYDYESDDYNHFLGRFE